MVITPSEASLKLHEGYKREEEIKPLIDQHQKETLSLTEELKGIIRGRKGYLDILRTRRSRKAKVEEQPRRRGRTPGSKNKKKALASQTTEPISSTGAGLPSEDEIRATATCPHCNLLLKDCKCGQGIPDPIKPTEFP